MKTRGLMAAAAAVAIIGYGIGTGVADDATALNKPFRHRTHLALKKEGASRKYTCGDCHSLSKLEGTAGQKSSFPICETVRMPFPAHDKCIGCHPKAFYEKPLQICTSCHVDAVVSEMSKLKEQSGDRAPLRTVFNHKKHLKADKKKKRLKTGDCRFCYRASAKKDMTLPEHKNCCECHTKADVEPNINQCGSCHKRPPNEKNPRSMVRKFRHRDHRKNTVTGKNLGCLRCHFEVPKAKKVATLRLPKMATCVECHQGEIAFSYTDCLKCHEKGSLDTKLVPASHKAQIKKGLKKR